MGVHLDQPILYIASIDNEGVMKDLTPKYHLNWLSKGIKLRPEGRFFEDTLAHFAPEEDKEDHIVEQKEVANVHEKQGLPKTIAEYKNHPKYVLVRHLLKFEAIYPRDAEVLGYVNKEAVYPRECVKLLRSKDTWHRYGRQVREGEVAYNVVKARPKWDRRNDVMLKDLPLDVFGEWQTEPYKPPEAKDGRVPRNRFGNVELFHEDMLPAGTAHLKLPGLHRIAEELGIDCVPAVVGFEGVARGCHPVLEGYVVCVEHKETLEAAWLEIQNEDRRRRRERVRKRALKNWRKITHKVMWNNRLNKKYKNNL
ncbi:DNA repair protein rhp42-like [Tropilaelaps mercedesae]|uniref:DNA repair protein rhp42-like n=1 Tax=Tropilaelaps mercedesae TaxID=418985 RepID=A0A1V9XPU1_9ACAR|nr:DNA repair protein rhp42-like [Tropilaelaps mercedesae]